MRERRLPSGNGNEKPGNRLLPGKTTSDFLRFWHRADAYLQEKDVELKGYKASVRTCPATFESLKRFLGSLDAVAS